MKKKSLLTLLVILIFAVAPLTTLAHYDKATVSYNFKYRLSTSGSPSTVDANGLIYITADSTEIGSSNQAYFHIDLYRINGLWGSKYLGNGSFKRNGVSTSAYATDKNGVRDYFLIFTKA